MIGDRRAERAQRFLPLLIDYHVEEDIKTKDGVEGIVCIDCTQRYRGIGAAPICLRFGDRRG
ncbi:hypothetical protein D3C87_2203570 [compost metagenome]